MYKTVRKGDASLQYTILPQTDQFSSGGLSQTSSKPRSRIMRYTMGSLMVLIILSCIATPFLVNQNDHNLFASTVLAMSRLSHNAPAKNSSRSLAKEVHSGRIRVTSAPTTIFISETLKANHLEDSSTSVSFNVAKSKEQDAVGITPTDSTATTVQHAQITPEVEPTVRIVQTSTLPSTTVGTTSILASKAATEGTTESIKTASNVPWKVKMPRVTLKLRENETIPQMYMKAGIASYKKGNITTSVLAHGLSLEGLIFKTPEGTIKPWPQKWFFTDPSSEFQWKGANQMPVTVYIILAGLAAMASVSIVLMFYVQRRTSKRHRQCIEEPEVAGQEEDKSTLLGAESQETEEKE